MCREGSPRYASVLPPLLSLPDIWNIRKSGQMAPFGFFGALPPFNADQFTSKMAISGKRNPPTQQFSYGVVRKGVVADNCLKFSLEKGTSGSRKRGGLRLRGVAFMTVLAILTVLAVLESTLPSFCWSYKIQHNETAENSFDGFGGHGGFSHDGYRP